MGTIQGSTGRALVLTASLLAAPGCAPWGDSGWGAPAPPARSAVLDGEVWSVDSRRGRLQVRSDRGRTSVLRVDRATRVVYRRRSYPVDALERGDRVRIWLEIDPRGEAWADRVEVRENVRHREFGDRDRIERIEGRLWELNLRRGYFTVDVGFDGPVAVYFPDELDRKERRRLERLRRGDRVRADVRPISDSEAELVRLQ